MSRVLLKTIVNDYLAKMFLEDIVANKKLSNVSTSRVELCNDIIQCIPESSRSDFGNSDSTMAANFYCLYDAKDNYAKERIGYYIRRQDNCNSTIVKNEDIGGSNNIQNTGHIKVENGNIIRLNDKYACVEVGNEIFKLYNLITNEVLYERLLTAKYNKIDDRYLVYALGEYPRWILLDGEFKELASIKTGLCKFDTDTFMKATVINISSNGVKAYRMDGSVIQQLSD